MEFDYEKAWFMLARRDVLKFKENQKDAVSKLIPLLGELHQQSLKIPISKTIRGILDTLPDAELAFMGRACMFYAHWKPGGEKLIYANSKGEMWKICNVATTILRERIPEAYIVDCGLRVTYSGGGSWRWVEFAAATRENFKKYKKLERSFLDENGLITFDSIEVLGSKLIAKFGDPYYDGTYIRGYSKDMKDYLKFIERKSKAEGKEEIAKSRRILAQVKGKIAVEKEKFKVMKFLLKNKVNLDYVLYYDHIDTFCFGWYKPIAKSEVNRIEKILKDNNFNHKYEFKIKEEK